MLCFGVLLFIQCDLLDIRFFYEHMRIIQYYTEDLIKKDNFIIQKPNLSKKVD